VSDIVTDNRKVTEGAMFIAIKGNRVDGHNFVESAYESGAICTLVEKDIKSDKPYIIVENSLIAIKKIAKFYRENLEIKVVGITGSVGKTSTKEMIYSVLSQKYNVLKTEGNFNNELGLPLTIFRIREEHEIAVLEMGISDFGEMTRLSEIAKPDVAVITNIGLCHLENLKTRDGILQAKTEMFKNINDNAKIVLNGDDDKLCTIKDYNGIKPIFYYIDNCDNNGIYADEIKNEGIKGIKCNIHCNTANNKNSDIEVMINIPGRHMVYNALAATCVGKTFGLSDSEIKSGIEKLKPVSGRNNIIEVGNLTVIDDCYNANPVSMKASIDVLSYAEGRKVAILGDMFELGDNESELHSEIGAYLTESNIDIIVLVGDLMNNAFKKLLQTDTNNKKVYYFENLEDALEQLDNIIKQDDTILVKASHGMKFSRIIDFFKTLL
jgi:UDP-N-acetylmuramoyl-tripeptide--D-alanyl-D-alanine ligase